MAGLDQEAQVCLKRRYQATGNTMEVLYHCDCGRQSTSDESAPVLSRSYEHHSLDQLFFCEECDAIRCPRCISEEVVCYYCPLCLFEVPTASVRGEYHRCARNCFLCPQCTHTLSVTASDPANVEDLRSPASNVGEPPYYLSCSFCRWDSKEVGISFEKPTGLALQLQKAEAATPAVQSVEHVKDHLEPFLKAGIAAAIQAQTGSIPRSSTLPSLPSRYGSLLGLAHRSRPAITIAPTAKDELEAYEPLYAFKDEAKKESKRINLMKNLISLDEVSSIQQRAINPWQQTMDATQLRPTRVPLQAKRTKRCSTCRHILSKPEAKSTSIKYKIKLVACNYLPAIELFRRPPITSAGVSRISAAGAGAASIRRARPSTVRGEGALTQESDPLRPGRSYSFEVAFVNPLYDAIQVRLDLSSSASATTGGDPAAVSQDSTEEVPIVPPFTLSFPTTSFGINAYAEQWEYEDAEDENDMDIDDASSSRKSKKRLPIGIVEKKANRTTVLLELTVGKEFTGSIKSHLLVTYLYSAEPAAALDEKKPPGDSETKSFSFWTVLQLGNVQPMQAIKASRILNPATFVAPT